MAKKEREAEVETEEVEEGKSGSKSYAELEEEAKILRDKLKKLISKKKEEDDDEPEALEATKDEEDLVKILVRKEVEPCTIGQKRWAFKAGQKARVPRDVAIVLEEAGKL